jgi:hypothetical protein
MQCITTLHRQRHDGPPFRLTLTATPHLTKPVDVLPLPIPGTSGLSSIAGCAEKHRALFTAVFLVVLRAMIAVVVTMRLA